MIIGGVLIGRQWNWISSHRRALQTSILLGTTTPFPAHAHIRHTPLEGQPTQGSSNVKSFRPLATRMIDSRSLSDGRSGGREQSGPSGTSTNDVALRTRLKEAVKAYGSTVMVFHITMSLCSLGMFYTLVASGLDVFAILSKIGINVESNKIAEGASTFIIAYAVHKVFAPLRITLTLTATPFIVKKLRSMGVLKRSGGGVRGPEAGQKD